MNNEKKFTFPCTTKTGEAEIVITVWMETQKGTYGNTNTWKTKGFLLEKETGEVLTVKYTFGKDNSVIVIRGGQEKVRQVDVSCIDEYRRECSRNRIAYEKANPTQDETAERMDGYWEDTHNL